MFFVFFFLYAANSQKHDTVMNGYFEILEKHQKKKKNDPPRICMGVLQKEAIRQGAKVQTGLWQ